MKIEPATFSGAKRWLLFWKWDHKRYVRYRNSHGHTKRFVPRGSRVNSTRKRNLKYLHSVKSPGKYLKYQESKVRKPPIYETINQRRKHSFLSCLAREGSWRAFTRDPNDFALNKFITMIRLVNVCNLLHQRKY